MSQASQTTIRRSRPIPSLRWWIGGLLFASTVINYLDRQTLSLLAPYLKLEYHWSNTDYANIVIAFGSRTPLDKTALGRFIDRVGTRQGLSITVAWYSVGFHPDGIRERAGEFCGIPFLA